MPFFISGLILASKTHQKAQTVVVWARVEYTFTYACTSYVCIHTHTKNPYTQVVSGLTRRSSPKVPPLSVDPPPRTLSILSRTELEMKPFKSSASHSYSGAARFSLLNRAVCSDTAWNKLGIIACKKKQADSHKVGCLKQRGKQEGGSQRLPSNWKPNRVFIDLDVGVAPIATCECCIRKVAFVATLPRAHGEVFHVSQTRKTNSISVQDCSQNSPSWCTSSDKTLFFVRAARPFQNRNRV